MAEIRTKQIIPLPSLHTYEHWKQTVMAELILQPYLPFAFIQRHKANSIWHETPRINKCCYLFYPSCWLNSSKHHPSRWRFIDISMSLLAKPKVDQHDLRLPQDNLADCVEVWKIRDIPAHLTWQQPAFFS